METRSRRDGYQHCREEGQRVRSGVHGTGPETRRACKRVLRPQEPVGGLKPIADWDLNDMGSNSGGVLILFLTRLSVINTGQETASVRDDTFYRPPSMLETPTTSMTHGKKAL